MTAWHTAFVRTGEAAPISAALLEALTALGYTRYDPFPAGTGTPPALKTFVKQLLSPVRDGWLRILGAPDMDALLLVSSSYPMLYGWLTDSDGSWRVLENGEAKTEPAAFTSFLKPNLTLEAVQRAQAGHVQPLPADAPTSPIPSDIQQLARDRGVNPKQADRMVERLTGQLFGRLDRGSGGEAGAMRGQAEAMLKSGLDWNTPPGQRLRAVAETLALPADWRVPGFDEAREAYHIARLLMRNPKASLLPAERESYKAVPDAGHYTAVYVGKA